MACPRAENKHLIREFMEQLKRDSALLDELRAELDTRPPTVTYVSYVPIYLITNACVWDLWYLPTAGAGVVWITSPSRCTYYHTRLLGGIVHLVPWCLPTDVYFILYTRKLVTQLSSIFLQLISLRPLHKLQYMCVYNIDNTIYIFNIISMIYNSKIDLYIMIFANRWMHV